VGLHDGHRGPRHRPFTTPPHIVALILEIRRERQYGPLRVRFFLERYHQVYVSAPTIYRILKQHRVPRVSLKRYRTRRVDLGIRRGLRRVSRGDQRVLFSRRQRCLWGH